MDIHALHDWDVSPAEALRLQEELRGRLVRENGLGKVATVAGADVSVRGELARAAVVVLSYPDLVVLEVATAVAPATFPYIPGLLAFREAPAILAACAQLRHEPDLFIFDGHGRAHPRRLGIACHVGLFLDRPTIGCAKSRLCGEHAPVPEAAGAWVPLVDAGETIGAAVRTRGGVRPVYVSAGHRSDLATAVHYVLACCRGYRLPEPCRRAHAAAA